MSADDDIRVQLARMEGKQDVANERLSSAISDIADVRRTITAHSDRLGILEADKNRRDGELKGVVTVGRVIGYTVSLLVGGGIVGTAMELLK